MAISIFSHPKCRKHNMDPEHPECPKRLSQIQDQLIASGLATVVEQVQGSKIDREHLYPHSIHILTNCFTKMRNCKPKLNQKITP